MIFSTAAGWGMLFRCHNIAGIGCPFAQAVECSYRGIRENSVITSEQRHLESLKHQAKQLRRAPVRIVNAVPGGSDMLRFDAAARHVAAGRARWVQLTGGERRIEFVSRAQDAVVASAIANQAVHSTVATLAQVARLPMVRPGDVVAPSPRRHFGTVKSVWRNKQGRTSDERAYCDGIQKL